MGKKVIRVNRDMIADIVYECINEAKEKYDLDEGFFGGIGGLTKNYGNKLRNTAKNIGSRLSDTVRSGGNKIKSEFEKGKEVYKNASYNEDKKNAMKKCINLYNKNKGLLDKANQIKAQIAKIGDEFGITYRSVAYYASNNRKY